MKQCRVLISAKLIRPVTMTLSKNLCELICLVLFSIGHEKDALNVMMLIILIWFVNRAPKRIDFRGVRIDYES